MHAFCHVVSLQSGRAITSSPHRGDWPSIAAAAALSVLASGVDNACDSPLTAFEGDVVATRRDLEASLQRGKLARASLCGGGSSGAEPRQLSNWRRAPEEPLARSSHLHSKLAFQPVRSGKDGHALASVPVDMLVQPLWQLINSCSYW